MKTGRRVVFSIALFFVYLLLCTTLFFSIPFMVTWGEEKSWYLNILSFLQGHPFTLIKKGGDLAIGLLFINALFWTLCIAALLYFVARLLGKK